jgi:CRISPR system Cascade subunit CasA
MTDVLHDLLDSDCFGVRLAPQSRDSLSLPEVLQHLGQGDIHSFTALQAHQRQAWYAFLVQLAAVALHAGDEVLGSWPGSERWHALLLEITGGHRDPWSLVVSNLSAPAFMQPPVPEGSLEKFKRTFEYPDALDVLLTGRDHDLKHSRIRHAAPEHWAYALVSLQTMEGYLGAGNQGIARMNGGFASRPCVGYTPGLGWGERFRRDVAVLRRSRPQVVSQHGYTTRSGLTLLWLEPWDGTDSIDLGRCDPYFIEICRRVRLVTAGGTVFARGITTKVQRLQAKERKGDVGDPWIPVNKASGTALTVSGSGFSYRRTHELLFSPDYERATSQRIYDDDSEQLIFTATVLARGQGQTDGLHERRVPVPPRVKAMLGTSQGRESLGAIARRRVEDVATAQKKLLKPAVLSLLQSAPDKLDFKDDRGRPWIVAHDDAVDAVFFEQLWQDLDVPAEQADARWQRLVIRLAEAQLRDAIASVPVAAARRYRAQAAAESRFRSAMYKHFADAMDKEVTT